MITSSLYGSSSHKIALIGNYLPRQCGIATFTADLLTALAQEDTETEYWAMVMNDVADGYCYPPQVRFELNQKFLMDYPLAADFLNMNQVDVACLQHEFGIFGGDYGAYILELLTNLRMPLVTTLHTVLKNPSSGQKAILKKIALISSRLVVMSHWAKDILKSVYGVSEKKIITIHHGIPDVPFVDPNYYKDQFGVEGRKVVLTFGLLSPDKGIEVMIEALPEVVSCHPETVYIIVGTTHPHIKKDQGEAYRLFLQRRARELGVSKHLIFQNRFVDLTELCEPYLNKERIVSGTLAYALGTGKATISTPYWYAEEMLAEGRGRIVPFKNPAALATEINDLFTNEVERHAMRKRVYTFCRGMVWKEVAQKHVELFAEVRRERERKPRYVYKIKTMETKPQEMPELKLDHLIRLTDNVGILQHAKYIVPNRHHGYCTDDNARALIAVLMARDLISDTETLTDLACIYIGFLHHAFNHKSGRFRNFMGFDRQWLKEEGSPDSHARAVWSLGEAVALTESNEIRAVCLEVFSWALPALLDIQDPRSWSFALVGIHAYLRKFSGDSEVRRIREKLATQLFKLYQENSSEDWPWIEDTLTYANGKIPQALIMSGQWLQRGDMLEAGLDSLQWLVDIQTDTKGHLVPIGNNGWFNREGQKARFDQQPIEAMNIIEACREAYNVTRDTKWILCAQRSLEWFMGSNDLNTSLYDYKTGGCCDGLSADGPNRNQGAESTLAWLLSLLNIYQLKSTQITDRASKETEGEILTKGGVCVS
jgi:glycosyltransferase involved in cell wall biosynthesis